MRLIYCQPIELEAHSFAKQKYGLFDVDDVFCPAHNWGCWYQTFWLKCLLHNVFPLKTPCLGPWGLMKKLKREFDRIKSDVQDVKEDVKEMREADVPSKCRKQMWSFFEFLKFWTKLPFFFGS